MTLGNAYFTAQGLVKRIAADRIPGKLSNTEISICLELMMVFLQNK